MTLLNELFNPYSFKGLVDLIINKIGYSSLIIIFAAYLGAIVYSSTIPSKGRFSTDYPQINAAGFFQQLFYALSIVIIFMPFISGWSTFVLVLVLYGAIAVPLVINALIFRQDFSFKEYLAFKNSPRSIRRKYYGIGLLWLSIIAELFVFFYFNLTIPLVGWAIIVYSFAVAFLSSALTQSTLFNASTCPYCKITTVDGITEGFIIAKGEDNYLVKTNENSDILLSSSYVKTISPIPVPKTSENSAR